MCELAAVLLCERPAEFHSWFPRACVKTLDADPADHQRMNVTRFSMIHSCYTHMPGVAGKQYSSTFHFSTLVVHSAVPGTASLAYTCMTNNTFRS